MTTGEAIRAALLADAAVLALVSERIFPGVLPQGAVQDGKGPAIVFSVISDVPENSLTGDSKTRTVNARVQLTGWSLDYDEAQAVGKAVDDVLSALASPTLSGTRSNSEDVYEDETQLYGVRADYSIWR